MDAHRAVAIARGTATANIVVVDALPTAVEAAKALGCTLPQGDAMRDPTL